MSTKETEKYTYQTGPEGESILPELMEGALVEKKEVTRECDGRLVRYELRLETGVVIFLPLLARGTFRGVELGDHFRIETRKDIFEGKEKVYPDQKAIEVTRSETRVLGFVVTNNHIVLDSTSSSPL